MNRPIPNGTMSAYPVENCITDSSGQYEGLTKREAFAMAAMQGLIAIDIENIYTTTDIAEISVTQADALLKELSK